MEGVRAYDCSGFHPQCLGVEVVDIGGFGWLWCPVCGVLCNMEAVSPKFQDFNSACCAKPGPAQIALPEVKP